MGRESPRPGGGQVVGPAKKEGALSLHKILICSFEQAQHDPDLDTSY